LFYITAAATFNNDIFYAVQVQDSGQRQTRRASADNAYLGTHTSLPKDFGVVVR